VSHLRATALTTRFRDEEGSTLLLTLFYAALSLVLILVVVAATSLYLERKRLFTLADGAALAAAEASQFDAVGRDGTDPTRTVNAADVDSAVAAYLALPHGPFEGLAVTRAFSADGYSATVTLSAQWRPPVLTLLIPAGLTVDVTAVARSVLW